MARQGAANTEVDQNALNIQAYVRNIIWMENMEGPLKYSTTTPLEINMFNAIILYVCALIPRNYSLQLCFRFIRSRLALDKVFCELHLAPLTIELRVLVVPKPITQFLCICFL